MRNPFQRDNLISIKAEMDKLPPDSHQETSAIEIEAQPAAEPISKEVALAESELVEEFYVRSKEYYQRISRLYQGDETRKLLKPGPTYSITTSKGAPIIVETLVIDELPNIRDYYLFAEDSNTRVVADSYFTVVSQGESSAFCNNIDVMTGVRGQGIGSAMVKVYENILELEASRLGVKISAPVSDHNLMDLKSLELQLRENPDNQELQNAHQNKLKERERWEASIGKRKTVFGPNFDLAGANHVKKVEFRDGEPLYTLVEQGADTLVFQTEEVHAILEKIKKTLENRENQN